MISESWRVSICVCVVLVDTHCIILPGGQLARGSLTGDVSKAGGLLAVCSTTSIL
jgi:hypothetical protein